MENKRSDLWKMHVREQPTIKRVFIDMKKKSWIFLSFLIESIQEQYNDTMNGSHKKMRRKSKSFFNPEGQINRISFIVCVE